ncbi:hypothetical protein COLO4_15362 [Corchorus olitorius]|uniref:FAR1 domain-containing protein n=1 Tax=Corchorus olitorius TaxID=93759 RepID=A0A1R3JNL5_9ROSI|nr:hypothetical protein COLO4_15362 [Corchorus olitorius]
MVEPPMDEEITLVDGIDQEYLCETNLEVSNENHDEHGNEENSGNNQEILEPYNGMEFESLEEGLEYYTKEDRTQVAPDETRTGCKAMIYVSKKVGVDRWIISRFTRDHNHELATPKSAPFLRAHRKRTRAQRNLIDVLDDSGVRPSKIMSVLATESGGIDKKGHTIRTCRLLKESRCGSSAEITSDPNATKQVSSSHIDQDSNTPQNLNQGQGRFNNQAGYANWNK